MVSVINMHGATVGVVDNIANCVTSVVVADIMGIIDGISYCEEWHWHHQRH